jgi:uncharacterized protein YydD (DUF2326 family)
MYIRAAWKNRNPNHIRGWKGLNVSAMARDLGWKREKLADILTNRKPFVRFIHLVRIAEELRMGIDELKNSIETAERLDQERLELIILRAQARLRSAWLLSNRRGSENAPSDLK